MARKIIKKIGGDRIGSGPKMKVTASGFGVSTHNTSTVRRTSMAWGTVVPMAQYIMTPGSRLRLDIDAIITSNALKYQLYGSGKFMVDVFEAPLAIYNPLINLNFMDQGFEVNDIKLPLLELITKNLDLAGKNINNQQVNESALLRYLRITGNGQAENQASETVTREHMAAFVLMYYQVLKEYYANKQEKKGYIIHNKRAPSRITVFEVGLYDDSDQLITMLQEFDLHDHGAQLFAASDLHIKISYVVPSDELGLVMPKDGVWTTWEEQEHFERHEAPISKYFDSHSTTVDPADNRIKHLKLYNQNNADNMMLFGYANNFSEAGAIAFPQLQEYELKAIDRMVAKIHANLLTGSAIKLTGNDEFPYAAGLKNYGEWHSINGTQEGLGLACYESDVFNNYLDNATINALNAKNKIKVDENGEFTIDQLNITQKLYNHDMRIGITDGTIQEWQEMTYGVFMKSKSTKPVYSGGLIKEVVFNQVVSTASTDEDPLGAIASRGQFGRKHHGGRAVINAEETKLVLVNAVIIPRIVYNQGNAWWTTLKTLDDLHKPILDKIGYQNLITDTVASFDTIVNTDGTLTLRSVGKQPAWQWYKTNYDDALGNMASTEDYKVLGRDYQAFSQSDRIRIQDLTTYIDPTKHNHIWAVSSLDAMNFDVEVGIKAKYTAVMSEEVIPNI